MKQRSPLAVVGLSIITLGIYDLYWLAVTRRELNAKTEIKVPSIWVLISPAIVLIGAYILLFVAVISKNPATQYQIQQTQTPNSGIALLSFVLILIGFIASAIISVFWFFRFSKAINQYTRGKMSTAVSFLILYLIHLIGVALIQDAFNDMGAVPAGPSTATAQIPPQTMNPISNIPPSQPTPPDSPMPPAAPTA